VRPRILALRASFLAIALAASAAACRPATTASDKPASPSKMTPAEIAAKNTPAIVSIHTAKAMGTGFIVHKNGLIATNLHVVFGGGAEVKITLADKREFPVVEVMSGSRKHDLVIMRIEAKNLPTITLGDSDKMRPGDPVVAIGHPLGLEDTVSNGLVSALREVDEELKVLQISAPIAPGSSGGPLFNERGEVIGVATAIINGGQNINIGVPSNYVKALLRQQDPISMEAFAAATTPHAEPTQTPAARREIPKLPIATVAGCTPQAMQLILKSIGDAIDVGAPLYNQGNFAACFHVYEGAAADLERKLPATCKGPAKVLADGRKKAALAQGPSAQAWSMRDTFDALVDVVDRKTSGQ
jgi:serine protease Do